MEDGSVIAEKPDEVIDFVGHTHKQRLIRVQQHIKAQLIPEDIERGNSRACLRHGLSVGKLPKDAASIERRLNKFRRMVEDAVLEAKGCVTVTDAASIQTAIRWERHAALSHRTLVAKYEDLNPDQILNFSREIAKASAHRDKSLHDLKLERDIVIDAWSVIDAR